MRLCFAILSPFSFDQKQFDNNVLWSFLKSNFTQRRTCWKLKFVLGRIKDRVAVNNYEVEIMSRPKYNWPISKPQIVAMKRKKAPTLALSPHLWRLNKYYIRVEGNPCLALVKLTESIFQVEQIWFSFLMWFSLSPDWEEIEQSQKSPQIHSSPPSHNPSPSPHHQIGLFDHLQED